MRALLGRLLCRLGIHDSRLVSDWIPGRLGAAGRLVESPKCWRCGRYTAR